MASHSYPGASDLDEVFYALEFDGQQIDGDLSAEVEPAVGVEFGLPEDPFDVKPRPLDEFEAADEVHRSIAAIETIPRSTFSGDESSAEFDALGASLFTPSEGLFDTSSEMEAPLLPSFHRPARTSLRVAALPLKGLLTVIKKCFAAQSIVAEPLGGASETHFGCSAVRKMEVVTFECRVFRQSAVERAHLVEYQHLSGCMYAFSECFSDISSFLASYGLEATCSKHSLKYLPAAALDPPPSLCRSTSKSTEETTSHVSELLDSRDAETRAMGCRVLGSLVRSHPSKFADVGAWLPLADRAVALATELAQVHAAGEDMDNCVSAGLSLALGVVAKVCAVPEVCPRFLDSTLDLVAGALRDDDLPPHARRAALEAASMLVQHHGLALRLCGAGVVPSLEFEAQGEDDAAAARFAKGALVACRA